jgi:hypothetical protein
VALELQDAGLQALHSEWEQTLHLRKQWCKQSLTFGQLSAQWKLQGRLQSRADIDATMNDGTTALIIAAGVARSMRSRIAVIRPGQSTANHQMGATR